jgi:hypothetical protein
MKPLNAQYSPNILSTLSLRSSSNVKFHPLIFQDVQIKIKTFTHFLHGCEQAIHCRCVRPGCWEENVDLAGKTSEEAQDESMMIMCFSINESLRSMARGCGMDSFVSKLGPWQPHVNEATDLQKSADYEGRLASEERERESLLHEVDVARAGIAVP